MYVPAAFREEDLGALHAVMQAGRLANLVTATADGLIATPLPLLLAPDEGAYGTLYGHMARPNPQWKTAVVGEAMALFTGPEAYISPSWYPSKQEHHKVAPTWNYVAVHAYGVVEFFDDTARLLDVVTRLTERHENGREQPWAVGDAPEDFTASMLKGIIGVRMVIARIDGKRKMSQNRPEADRAGVVEGLARSAEALDRDVAKLIVV